MVSLKNGIMVTLMIYSKPQRENFPGGTKVNTGLPNLFRPPKPYRGPCRKIIFRPGTKLAQNFFPIFGPKLLKSKKKGLHSNLIRFFSPKNGEEQKLNAESWTLPGPPRPGYEVPPKPPSRKPWIYNTNTPSSIFLFNGFNFKKKKRKKSYYYRSRHTT